MANPGLHRSLLGDGISNVLSGFAGSPPNTTYGENIGVMAITRVYSVWVIRGAALLAIAFSLIGKVSTAIQTIPDAVMGGITMLLYGVIAVQGFRMFVSQKVDFSKNSNMVLGAITFVVGVSGASINIGTVQLKGMPRISPFISFRFNFPVDVSGNFSRNKIAFGRSNGVRSFFNV